MGTPLKDWDINIYRGVLTGCNEAFIISTDKRNEILANCETEEERARTEELIRPILRGRDIKRYGYDWANLYLIATFPACHYDIEDYPAVKGYLLSFAEFYLRNSGFDWVVDSYLHEFCMQKLSQTGKFIEIDGKRIVIRGSAEKARKKTSNKWFETQDSISYWEDFLKPKIVYMEIQTDNPKEGYPFPCFSFDNNKSVVLNTAYVMSSNSFDTRYILGILNSKLGKILVKLYVTQLQERQFRMLAQYVSNFPIVKPRKDIEKQMSSLVQQMLETKDSEIERQIDELAYSIYNMTDNETDLLNNEIDRE